MNIKEFDEKYYLHDSLVNSIAHDERNKTVTIMLDFCYWMQQDYKKGEQENGLLKVTFKNVTEYDGIQGNDKGDWWNVLDGDIKDGKYHLLIEDMEKVVLKIQSITMFTLNQMRSKSKICGER